MDQLANTETIDEADQPDVENMSRIELEDFAREHHDASAAARSGLKNLQQQFEQLQSLLGITANVEPDVIKGWRSWIARLDNERQKWMDKATALSEHLQKQRKTEEQRYAAIIEENGSLHSLLNDTVMRFSDIITIAEDTQEGKTDSKTEAALSEIVSVANDALKGLDDTLINESQIKGTNDHVQQ
jgi:hypothetical protein